MEQLVHQDPREFVRGTIERDAPLPQKGAGMHRTTTVAKACHAEDTDWLAG